jgi:outer membrane lipoprotein carrier protein
MRPSRFAMRFTRPRGDRVVADGRYLWLYTPSTTPGQVIRAAIPETGTTGPNLIGQFVDRPRERYQARYLRADSLADGFADVVVLIPRTTDLPYSEAVVWIDRDDGLVRRLEIVESSGQRRSVALSRLVVNRGVPSREFTFAPPAGSRVVDQ